MTGSNTGANAMFATTQAEIARSLGVDFLWFMAVRVAAAFLLMASPGKVEMAIQLTSGGAAEQRRWIQATVLWVALAVVGILALVNTLVIGGYAANLPLDNHYQSKKRKAMKVHFVVHRIVRGTGRL